MVSSGVLEAAVIGLPDDVFGEKVAAAIVPRYPPEKVNGEQRSEAKDSDGYEAGSFEKRLVDEVKKSLKESLAGYKQPRVYKVVESLPRNHLGKINKKTLRKDIGF